LFSFDNSKSTNQTTGLLKVIGIIENLEELGLPRVILGTVQKYNGKPVLITKSGEVGAGAL
jgi:hypothetical protein